MATGKTRSSGEAGGQRSVSGRTGEQGIAAGGDTGDRLVDVAACTDCRRRSWLLGKLGVRLDYRSRDESRLLELLRLSDEALIEAVGGRRRGQLRAEWLRRLDRRGAEETPSEEEQDAGVQTICRHRSGYPSGLGDDSGAPRMLHVLGGAHAAQRLARLTSRPTVAIVGSVQPSDYGMEMARGLARGLTASGVTVVGALANGIAAGAHAGALEADGASVMVMAGGVDVVAPVLREPLYARTLEHGCAVAEQPCGYPLRRWCEPARARVIAGLAQLTIVVEAGAGEAELRLARVTQSLGRTVAAMPGRVTSPVSVGTNALLMAGAPLVRGPADALDLLYRASPGASAENAGDDGVRWSGIQALLAREGQKHDDDEVELGDELRSVLAQVGAGRDTPGKLAAAGVDPGEAMLALSELEVLGLLARGDGGRYVPRESLV
jgi:DNA processing protein